MALGQGIKGNVFPEYHLGEGYWGGRRKVKYGVSISINMCSFKMLFKHRDESAHRKGYLQNILLINIKYFTIL